MKLPEGKYVLVKDPNKVRFLPIFPGIILIIRLQPVIRLYSVPPEAFTNENDNEDGAEEEEEEQDSAA